jgi:predicted ATPase
MHSALALWVLGYPARALERSRAGLALARELAHAGSIVNALAFATILHQLVDDRATLAELVASMVAMAASAEHGLSEWLAFARVFEGWIAVQPDGDPTEVQRQRQAIGDYRALGNDIWVPCFHALLADTLLKRGAADDGLATVAEALAMADATGSRLWTPEFHRLRGELLLVSGQGAEAGVEAEFAQAIEIARAHGTRSWELRAAMSLSRLWRRQGKRAEAHRLLAGIHGWFSEGLDTADLTQARRLLEELA